MVQNSVTLSVPTPMQLSSVISAVVCLDTKVSGAINCLALVNLVQNMM